MIAPLSAAGRPTIDNVTLRLADDQYEAEGPPGGKSLVVLHHTVGGSARSTVEWWRTDPRKVGTAYIVERDGRIFEVFPPECWGYHLGVKDAAIERRSIGIELASEGPLKIVRDEDSGRQMLYAAATGKVMGGVGELLSQNRAAHFPLGYRGYEWFDAYDEVQVRAVVRLVVWLCEKFGIPQRLPREAAMNGADLRRWYAFQGVLHHAMLRADKSDLHPGFPFDWLGRALHDPTWS